MTSSDEGSANRCALVSTTRLTVAAVASAGAGLVHAAAAGSHSGDPALQRIFALCAVAQVGWAGVGVLRPGRSVAVIGVGINGAALGAWLASRTVGLPVLDSLRDAEAVGTQDLVAALLAAAAIGFAIASLLPTRSRPPRWGATWLIGAGLAMALLSVPAMASEHVHSGEGHEHGAGAAHEHEATDSQAHDHGPEPIISLDDPRLSADQRAAAQELVDATIVGMEGFTDVASVEAAGYVSIGDARSGFEHFINWDHLDDGRELDASAIESVVFEVTPEGKRPVSAMYLLEDGKTMTDVPDIAGELTTWHDHQNLCWDPSGTRLRGVLMDGRCVPAGELWETPPMLHVWMQPHPCGPFAGLEGHGSDGAGCTHDHAMASPTRGG